MALVTEIKKRVDIPHEPGQSMEFRRLSWRQLEQASDVQTDGSFERMKRIGGDLLQALRQSASEQQADPFAGYDRATVLRLGIMSWSYDAEVSNETIDQLDEQTAEWAFREILSLSKPRTAEDSKNG